MVIGLWSALRHADELIQENKNKVDAMKDRVKKHKKKAYPSLQPYRYHCKRFSCGEDIY